MAIKLPSVSVVIPVYGADQFLRQCLDSLLSQRCTEKEIICVNDESPDNSLSILREYESHYPDEIQVIDQKNTGGATAINNGIRAAKNEFVIVMDCDDYLLPGGLDILLENAAITGADLVVGKILRLQDGVFSDLLETSWLKHDQILDSRSGRARLFSTSVYHGKLISRSLLQSDDMLMVDGMIYADAPFVSKLYVAANKISLMATNVIVWRKRGEEAEKSITDRKLEFHTLHDHIKSMHIVLDNAASAGRRDFVDSVAQMDTRRPIWHATPAWKAGNFSISHVHQFYDAVISYYQRVERVDYQRLPKSEAAAIWTLVNEKRALFTMVCFAFFLWIQFKMRRSRTKTWLKSKAPSKVQSALRRLFPKYPGRKTFRKLLKTVPQHNHMVIFESFLGKSYSGNPKYLYESLCEHYPQYQSVWVYEKNPHEIPGQPIQVRKFSYEYFYFLARAKYWVNNIKFSVHDARPSTVYVQTWHGTPLKRLGYDIEADGPEVTARENSYIESKNWSYLLSQNPHSSRIFPSAFRFKGKILDSGYPQNSIFHSDDGTARRKQTRQKLNIAKHAKVFLYAPTWRDQNAVGNWEFSADNAFDFDKWYENTPDDYILLARFHHLVRPPSLENYASRIINVSDYPDPQDLMLASDCLITDYSSILFDYLNTNNPMIFYAYDKERYIDEHRGLYLSLDELPGPVVSEFDEVLTSARKLEELNSETEVDRMDFARRYTPWDGRDVAEDVWSAVL